MATHAIREEVFSLRGRCHRSRDRSDAPTAPEVGRSGESGRQTGGGDSLAGIGCDELLQRAEWQYLAIVQNADIRLWEQPVRGGEGKAADGRDNCFWHLITGYDEEHAGRKLSLARVRSLGRTRELLELLAAGDPQAMWWRSGAELLVAPRDFSLSVTLKHRRTSFALFAQLPVASESCRQRLWREWEASWESGESFADCFTRGRGA